MEQGIRIRTVFLLCFIMAMWMPQMLSAQTCLPDGITFTTQSQIDSFPINYPNCSEIEGFVKIQDDNITNLHGLSSITSIEQGLAILNTDSLIDLTGLDNLHSLEGVLSIVGNKALQNLTGLGSVDKIWDSVKIINNPSLVSLIGLENLSVVRYFVLKNNARLVDMDGLHGLRHISGKLYVIDNDSLKNFEGLWILKNIILGLEVVNNASLINLKGLEGITHMATLSIRNNASLNDLTGLDNVDSVHMYMSIKDNPNLINISHLHNLSWVGSIWIQSNPRLLSLNGLERVRYCDDYVFIKENDSLINLSGLIGLQSIDGWLTIENNNSLKSLEGLDSLDGSTIEKLIIKNNPLLSICDVEPICDFINGLYGDAIIYNNLLYCNSIEEVAEACGIAEVVEIQVDSCLSVYPNPFTTSTTIEYELYTRSDIQYTVYNSFGEAVVEGEERNVAPGNHTITPSLHHLPSGLYYAMLRSGDGVSVVKLIKQ